MSEFLDEPRMPQGQEVRAAYREILDYNWHLYAQSTQLLFEADTACRPDDKHWGVLAAIGVNVRPNTRKNSDREQYRPYIEDSARFTHYIHTIDTDALAEDTTELMLIGDVLYEMHQMIAQEHAPNKTDDVDGQENSSEEILATFETIDEALSAKGLAPPAIYEAAMELEPSYRLNDDWRKIQEAKRYINPYRELVTCVMARNNKTLRFHFGS